jgi:hypothetical protein
MTLLEGFIIFMLLGISGRIYLIGNAIRTDLREVSGLLSEIAKKGEQNE